MILRCCRRQTRRTCDASTTGPVLSPPLPRDDEHAAPDAAPRSPRRGFVGDEVLRVSSVSDGPALANHPGANARAADAARGNQTPIAVAVPRVAAHCPPTDVVGQRIRCRLAAPPRLASELAQLAGLRRVDAMQANALPVNLNRVAVDDRRDADDGGCSF